MATGVEWMFSAVLKSLDLDPELVKKQLADGAQKVIAFDAKLDLIISNQREILEFLRPPDLSKLTLAIEDANGPERREHGAGNGIASGTETANPE